MMFKIFQRIVDNLSFMPVILSDSLLRNVTLKLDAEFKKYVTIVNETHEYVEKNCKASNSECGCFHQQFFGFYFHPVLPECSTIIPTFLRSVFLATSFYHVPQLIWQINKFLSKHLTATVLVSTACDCLPSNLGIAF